MEEHERALRSFISACEHIPSEHWHLAPTPEKWSAAQVALHICRAYEIARDSAGGSPGLRMRVTPLRAWALRNVLLPLMLSTGKFPHGVPAPREAKPDLVASEQLSREEAFTRLERVARQAAESLQLAEEQQPSLRLTHPYFGAMTPFAALRLLSAHTMHHARGLGSRPVR